MVVQLCDSREQVRLAPHLQWHYGIHIRACVPVVVCVKPHACSDIIRLWQFFAVDQGTHDMEYVKDQSLCWGESG